MNIITIVGARPQFVKAAVVSREISTHDDIHETIIHTGQHFDPNMSDLFFEEMRIPAPGYNLNINSLSHGAMTGKMLEEIEKVLLDKKPDWVLVYGDTNSTLAGALAAKKLHIRVAHVEAGLRSFNMTMPEEINRILTDRVSDILFCPTETATRNLKNEGFDHFDSRVVLSGDVMLDAALFYRQYSRPPQIELKRDFVLATLHRAENTDTPEYLSEIIRALETISREQDVLLPLHPRTRAKLEASGYNTRLSPIRFIDPVGYLEMIYLLDKCSLVMTDSGGLQKEAFFFRKYCITLRNETEWTELVAHGYNALAGNSYDRIIQAYREQPHPNFSTPLYGNGHAAKVIVDTLIEA
ncbi:non-hydrolyzing UDP-N-acetylglucosamine 2-epimerase [Butyricimonas hominis]|uniref:UDP-N-acetylglucosamine 2-epimerase (Non-hydrolyzing) n=1 Tax=Butyricimonas hominis TaxID=2763032 RepID=A0ABR7CW43_9BACT|nr:UDP-N-acetylglucosamine 2-epimerase (non-hydrolyzing) [Butyricimonas hominis]MBC5619883.1 UDP-N-acetylglucosamine 2-epimerase (non-hydrolyzing) [Butyricimonas hominis]